MKDWRGVSINEGDQVLWVHHAGNHWEPRVGVVAKVHEHTKNATVKRELTDADRRYSWRTPTGVALIPAYRLTRIDTLPIPDTDKGLDAI